MFSINQSPQKKSKIKETSFSWKISPGTLFHARQSATPQPAVVFCMCEAVKIWKRLLIKIFWYKAKIKIRAPTNWRVSHGIWVDIVTGKNCKCLTCEINRSNIAISWISRKMKSLIANNKIYKAKMEIWAPTNLLPNAHEQYILVKFG